MKIDSFLELVGIHNNKAGRQKEVREAAGANKLLSILYENVKGKSKRYLIEPYSFRKKPNGRVLYGWDKSEDKIKMFYQYGFHNKNKPLFTSTNICIYFNTSRNS